MPLLLLAAAAVAVRVEEELDGYAVAAVSALAGPPLLLVVAYAVRHARTTRLVAWADSVELTDWRGRRWSVRYPQTVVYCTIYSGGGRMEHVVVAGDRAEPPVLLRTRQWRPTELARLWRRLGLQPQVDDLTSVPGVRSRFPRVALPYVTRYPMTTGALGALGAFGWIALVISTIRAL